MPDPFPRALPARPSLEQLRKQAKDLLRLFASGDATAAQRFRNVLPKVTEASLGDAQFVIAREYGVESWPKLVQHVEAINPSSRSTQFEQFAKDLVSAYRIGEPDALKRLSDMFARPVTQDFVREHVQHRLKALTSTPRVDGEFSIADAQLITARQYGFESWDRLVESFASTAQDSGSAALGLSSTPPFYRIDWKENAIELRPPLSDKDWDTIFAVMKEHRITKLRTNGLLTDSAAARLTRLDHVTALDLDGSRRLTDDGLLLLAQMPQLQELNVSGPGISDRGLAVLRNLTDLRAFQMCWQRTVSDAGLANLTFCEPIHRVNLLGSTAGDGTINALRGKRELRFLSTGRHVTDAGLPLLHDIPAFKSWQGGEEVYDLMAFEAKPTNLLIDGPFTGKGLASLTGLEGVFGLSFFWHASAITPEDLEALGGLPNLGYLGCQGELCNDVAMRYIAAIPRLRMLMGQGSVASDDGFTMLSRSPTIEYIWGRECPNLRSRGFAALSTMPSLKGLAVSCVNVDDATLATLPRFPALRGLLPMDVSDDGFRHVGRCEQLEDLWCMYCRDTGDTATSHIAGLSRLKYYYAGSTQITDASLETLAGMASLERVELSDCRWISDTGIARLARLPRLRELSVGGSPNVTRQGMSAIPASVRVSYS
ncbi:MAG TPA: hypothetical protein VGQ52_04460 [Gemmatimonadaceae bacterium]|nr:hypothetical protein [Gemmatimonadaceae bacterium]